MASTFDSLSHRADPICKSFKCSKYGTNLNLTNFFFLYKMKIKFLSPWRRAWITYQRRKKNHWNNWDLLKFEIYFLKTICARHVLRRGLQQQTGDWPVWTDILPCLFLLPTSPHKSPVYFCKQIQFSPAFPRLTLNTPDKSGAEQNYSCAARPFKLRLALNTRGFPVHYKSQIM